MNEERQTYRDFLDKCQGLKGDLRFEGSEGGGYPAVVEFRHRPDTADIRAAFVLDRVLADFVIFEGLRDVRVQSIAVPMQCLIIVKEAPEDDGTPNVLAPSEL